MTPQETLAKTALASWKLTLERIESQLNKFTDDDLQREVAPGKNRIAYLVGHLTVVHDRLFPMLKLGQRLHPELDDEFLTNADRATTPETSLADIRKAWHDVHDKLTPALEAIPTEDWLLAHATVSAEDFEKDPLRNRFAVFLSRTGHAAFHAGQMRLVK